MSTSELCENSAENSGVTRALVSCDVPFGPVQEGVDSALRAAIRLVKEGGADMVKLDAASEFPDAVTALTRAGIPVFAQFGLTPQTALKYGVPYGAQSSAGAQATPEMTKKLVEDAKMLEAAGTNVFDFQFINDAWQRTFGLGNRQAARGKGGTGDRAGLDS